MIVTEDGYAIEQYLKSNQIIISLPQTYWCPTNTVGIISNRKPKLSTSELTIVLQLVRVLLDAKGEEK